MTLNLYNTLGRKLEEFTPLHGQQVGLYTCGPTVYSTAHIGNFRTYIFEDILRRTLEFNGYKVNQVMNVTDVGHLTSDADEGEDKIEKAAKSEHRSALEIAREHEQEFFHDLELLHIEPPMKIIRATETIDWQIDLIKKLEVKDVTYKTSDGIYFDTAKFTRYGELSGQKLQDKKAGARIETNSEKHHPTDFALWKFSKPEDKRQMEWPSPWGTGFPGWHIECSAMSMHELGDQFDIHCGGIDHIAVHHENEIAQSEAVTGKIPAKFWMHGEFLVTDKRMGKSEGNATTLQTVQEKGIDPLAFRFLCLQTHYRKRLKFTWESLVAAQKGLTSLQATISLLNDPPATSDVTDDPVLEKFQAAINNDLNMSEALAVFWNTVAARLDQAKKAALIKKMNTVLALPLQFAEPNQKHFEVTDPQIQKLLDDREIARKEKRFSDADTIRNTVESLGWIIDDTANGPKVQKK